MIYPDPRRDRGMDRGRLHALRSDVARIDAELVRLIAHRLDRARAIGRVKAAAGLPIRNRRVERAVVGRWKDGLEAAGVPRARAEEIARWLLEEAIRAQERGRAAPKDGRPRRVVVVGGAGRFGRWLAEFLVARGHAVSILDPARRTLPKGTRRVRDRRTALSNAEFVFLATPIRSTPGIYPTIDRAAPTAIVVDLLSVKAPVVPMIDRRRRAGRPVASVHPLFSPDPLTLGGLTVLVLDCGDAPSARATAALFRPSPLKLVRIPIARHDPLVAELQVLPRLVSLLFSEGHDPRSGGRGVNPPPSYRRQAAVARRSSAEGAALWADMLLGNPATPKLLRRLRVSLDRIHRRIERGDDRALVARRDRLAERLRG